jgi:hypothetical protein
MKVYLKNHKSLLSFFDRPRKHNISQSPKKIKKIKYLNQMKNESNLLKLYLS